MRTKILRLSPAAPKRELIQSAAEVLRRGGLVAFPTETVYGLGANALDAKAVRAVFAAKGRPSDNPLIVHVASVQQARELVREFPETAEKLAKKFWPGPLTLVLKHSGRLPEIVTTGLDTVAVRMPLQPVARALIRALGQPIVGPSANLSGRPSPTSAEHVAKDLDGKVDLILDAGPTPIGMESTVLDVTTEPPVILRLGGLTKERIEKVVGHVLIGAGKRCLRRSPGTRHRHYSPQAKVVLVEQGDVRAFASCLKNAKAQKVGALVHSKKLRTVARKVAVRFLSSRVEKFARELFRALRELDEQGVKMIVVEAVPPRGLGATVMDRLQRAAGVKMRQH